MWAIRNIITDNHMARHTLLSNGILGTLLEYLQAVVKVPETQHSTPLQMQHITVGIACVSFFLRQDDITVTQEYLACYAFFLEL